MKKTLLFLVLLTPWFIFCQIQIGQDIDGEAANDSSGYNVSLSSDGTIVAIGAIWNDSNGNSSGHVRIYENVSDTWIQIGSDIDGEAASNLSGHSVSLSSDGTIVAIGAIWNNDNGSASGHVRIYENVLGVWTQIGQDIDGEAPNNSSGWSVSLSNDGSIVAIGSPGNNDNGSGSGQARIYENISGVWTQIGQDIEGEIANNLCGTSLSLSSDGNIVAIGSPGNIESDNSSGHVSVYENISGVWTQIGLDIFGEANGDNFGYSVSLSDDGGIIAIGGRYNDDNGSNSGHVRVYENISGVWTQIGSDIDGETNGDNFGDSVSLSSDGSILAIGARYNDSNGNVSGHVRIYKNVSDVWTKKGEDIESEASGDLSGSSVSLSSDGSIIAIGSPGNDGNGNASGHVRVFDVSGVLSTMEFIKSEFVLYPNPVSDEFNLVLPEESEIEKLIIYNNLGQFIQSSTETTVDISDLSKGIYFVEVITNTGKSAQKIIKE